MVGLESKNGPRPAESEDAPSKAKTGSKSTPTSPARPDDERHVHDTVTSRAQFDTSSRKRLSSVSNVQDRAPAVVERMARAKGRTDADWRSIADGLGAGPDETEMDAWMRLFERHCAADFEEQMMLEVHPGYSKTCTFAFLDVTPFVRNAMSAVVEDSFTKCFESQEKVRWDNTFYLLPLSYAGVLIRYGVLFPIRLLIVVAGMLLFGVMYCVAATLSEEKKLRVQTSAVYTLNMFFLWSWCAVVLEKGEIPPREPGQIYVSNHSTVIDIVVLMKGQLYSLTGQAHEGTIGFFQKYILFPMGNLWFNRKENKDRIKVAKAIEEHSMDTTKPPLLVFPEGTCVNNEYVVMFKQGAFQLGKSVVPVAIKYNKVFVDAYWNSRTTSYPRHLFRLMTAWALVAEVSYLDPQYRLPGESAINFAARVKEMIAKEAGMGSVPWNGMLKYYKPRPEYKSNRQRIYAKMLKKRFGMEDSTSPAISPDPPVITEVDADESRKDR
jgi:glycerol-3-phosphate O-acyltransferase 3/4